MPMVIVVGGQFGSEGKGKVACYLAEQRKARAVVRVGGPNSGHTVIDSKGRKRIFRQLPTAAVLPDTECIVSAGSYIDLDVLLSEISMSNLEASRVKVDEKAVIITPELKQREKDACLRDRIGSTLTGTGAAVSQRVNREQGIQFARDVSVLKPYLCDAAEYMDRLMQRGDFVIAEGSQGYGLSVIHSPHFPFVTSRDTTAAGVLSEIGLSPRGVSEIALVIRAFPIRVPGSSGPLSNEITWQEVSRESGADCEFEELTSVTRSRRRIARFDAKIVRQAIRANAPTTIFLNHLDYIDVTCSSGRITEQAFRYVEKIECEIDRRIDFIGVSPEKVMLHAKAIIDSAAA